MADKSNQMGGWCWLYTWTFFFPFSWALSNNLPQLLRLLHAREREKRVQHRKRNKSAELFCLVIWQPRVKQAARLAWKPNERNCFVFLFFLQRSRKWSKKEEERLTHTHKKKTVDDQSSPISIFQLRYRGEKKNSRPNYYLLVAPRVLELKWEKMDESCEGLF